MNQSATIKKSKRAKHISIRVRGDGEVFMTVPQHTPLLVARQFLKAKQHWVNKQLLKLRPNEHRFKPDQQIGKTHVLAFENSQDSTVKLRRGVIVVCIPGGEDAANTTGAQKLAKRGVFKALRKEAAIYLPKRLHLLARQHDFAYNAIRFKNTSTRWGSCSNAGNINLNIQLMRLPHHLIDYVIIHELCHLKHQNHSRAFWQLIESIMPNAKSLRSELRQHAIWYKA